MPSFYTVVQYVPDPVTDERMNVGVIVFGGGRVQSRFVDNWKRVRSFGSEDIGFLKRFARQADELDEDTIRKLADTWDRSIKLTKPAGSLLTPGRLLTDVASRYLREWEPPAREYRGRSHAIALASSKVKHALVDLLGRDARHLVKKDLPIPGRTGEHEFDFGAENGRPYFAARALSFERPESKVLHRDTESTAWALDDVRKENKELPLGVVVLPPRDDEPEFYSQAIRIFEDCGATVIEEQALDEWASSMAELVGQHWHDE